MLLGDVFKTFRNICLEHYNLDPAHFYTSPGLGWQALLKTAYRPLRNDCALCQDTFKLELLTDIDMLLLFGKDIQGGITQAVKYYAKNKSRYLKEQYNPDEASTYLQYLDTNNLYGWAMIQKLPLFGFAWEKADDFTPEKIDKLFKTYKKGYILEFDVEYLKELRKNHNELPFLVERMEIGKLERLAPNLKDKKMYVIHIKNLDQALKYG